MMVKHEHSFHNFILAYLNWMLQSSEQHPSQKQTGNKHIKGQWLSPRPYTITNYLITKGYLSTNSLGLRLPVCENLTIFKKSFILTKSHLFPFSPSLSVDHFQVAASLCFKVRLSAKPQIREWFYILMQTKLSLTRKVLHFTSFWKWEFLELGNGLLYTVKNEMRNSCGVIFL